MRTIKLESLTEEVQNELLMNGVEYADTECTTILVDDEVEDIINCHASVAN